LEYLPGVFKDDSAYIEKYQARFYPDGRLEEKFTYQLNQDGFRMLFRSWRAPVSLKSLEIPYIEVIDVIGPIGTISYLVDNSYEPFIISPLGANPSDYWDLLMLAEANEVGVMNPGRFDPGVYEVIFLFNIHPPLEFDDEIGHLNLMFASEHLEYKSVEIVFVDASYVQEIFSHPPSLQLERQDGDIIITGKSGKDMLLEVEMLIELDAIRAFDGFPNFISDIRESTVRVNSILKMEYSASLILKNGARVLALVTPFLLFFVYYLYGREINYTVPRYLSTIPNSQRKPWLVNQVFKSDVLDYDADGFYATILDLHRRGIVKLESKPGGLIIKLNRGALEDNYERRVMGFLQSLAQKDIVDTNRLSQLAESIKEGGESATWAYELQDRLESLTTEVDVDLASEFVLSGKRRIAPLLVLPSIVIAISYLLISNSSLVQIRNFAVVTSLIPIIQVLIALGFPSSLFGKWRGGAYKEKLEWDAFTRHLDELSQIERYPPEDIGMWGEWLVYGTALGVGDSVARALKQLDIDLPEAQYARSMPVYFHPFVVASTRKVSSSGGRVSGSFGGGGFGAGGGFGGGGGGVR
jgi:uncharacterized membrane protein